MTEKEILFDRLEELIDQLDTVEAKNFPEVCKEIKQTFRNFKASLREMDIINEYDRGAPYSNDKEAIESFYKDTPHIVNITNAFIETAKEKSKRSKKGVIFGKQVDVMEKIIWRYGFLSKEVELVISSGIDLILARLGDQAVSDKKSPQNQKS